MILLILTVYMRFQPQQVRGIKPYRLRLINNGLKKFYYRNSFNPIIRGIIYEDQNSTIIKLEVLQIV